MVGEKSNIWVQHINRDYKNIIDIDLNQIESISNNIGLKSLYDEGFGGKLATNHYGFLIKFANPADQVAVNLTKFFGHLK